jgi:hypothetical protein
VKRAFLLLAIVLLGACFSGEPDARVLFVGNSYTFYNDMPVMVSRLAESVDVDLEVDTVTEGGAWLRDHRQNGVASDKITSGEFDYAVIQEQSAVPSDIELAREVMFPAASAFANDALAADATLVLFETWGYLSGFADTGHDNYNSMQNAINATYHELADLVGQPLAPAGEAWQEALNAGSGIRLHQQDRSHPTTEGSYLAALVIASTITGVSPTEMTFDAGLPVGVASLLRQYAAQAIA